MGIIHAEQGMNKQLFHARLKLIKVLICLISSPFSAGIQPDSGKVRFGLRRDAQPAHQSTAVSRLRPAALIADISSRLARPLDSPSTRACLSKARRSLAC